MTETITHTSRRRVRAAGIAIAAALVTVGSLAIAAPANAATVKTGSVAITGNAITGYTLTAKRSGTWTSGATFKYQWFRSGKAISGATKNTYLTTQADANKKVSVQVTESKSGYTAAHKTSAAVTVANYFTKVYGNFSTVTSTQNGGSKTISVPQYNGAIVSVNYPGTGNITIEAYDSSNSDLGQLMWGTGKKYTGTFLINPKPAGVAKIKVTVTSGVTTTVKLMPVAKAPFNSTHGYQDQVFLYNGTSSKSVKFTNQKTSGSNLFWVDEYYAANGEANYDDWLIDGDTTTGAWSGSKTVHRGPAVFQITSDSHWSDSF